MKPLLYEFDSYDGVSIGSYIFQHVKDRALTDVYHSHDFYELILFTHAGATQTVNECELVNRENDAVILRPGDRHCFVSQDNGVEIISLSVEKNEFELFANAYSPMLLEYIKNEPSTIRFSCSYKDSADIKQYVTEYDCKLLLSFFLYEYISCGGFIKQSVSLPRKLASSIREMSKKENLKGGISAFTELSHYSQSHLARLIKKNFGVSLKKYINELRLQSAYKSLVLTNEPAEQICEGLGFSSFSHFNKIFKERFSVTPSALRKKNGGLI